MSRRLVPGATFALMFLVTLGACGSGGQPSRAASSTNAAANRRTPSARGPASAASPGLCPVTTPNGATPPGEEQAGLNHGNGLLWTVLWPHGVVVATGDQILPDGSIEMKFPWWRGVRGRLSIEGDRLDGPAPPLRSVISDYGLTGFQASGVIFPTPGCWEVTGRVKAASLTFVTLVVAR